VDCPVSRSATTSLTHSRANHHRCTELPSLKSWRRINHHPDDQCVPNKFLITLLSVQTPYEFEVQWIEAQYSKVPYALAQRRSNTASGALERRPLKKLQKCSRSTFLPSPIAPKIFGSICFKGKCKDPIGLRFGSKTLRHESSSDALMRRYSPQKRVLNDSPCVLFLPQSSFVAE